MATPTLASAADAGRVLLAQPVVLGEPPGVLARSSVPLASALATSNDVAKLEVAMRSDVGGKRILFWDDLNGALQPLLDFLGVVPGGRKSGQPKDHVRNDVPWADREEVARALQLRSTMNPTGGDVLMGYLGWANCRICNEQLGTRDFFGHSFVWPEKADHYVLNHNVWTPDCNELLIAVRRVRRKAP